MAFASIPIQAGPLNRWYVTKQIASAAAQYQVRVELQNLGPFARQTNVNVDGDQSKVDAFINKIKHDLRDDGWQDV